MIVVNDDSPRNELNYYLSLLNGYAFDDGILTLNQGSKINPIANFIPVPIEEILYDDGIKPERFFKIQGIKIVDDIILYLPTVTVKSNQASSMNWVIDEWGFEATLFPPKQTKNELLWSVAYAIGSKIAKQRRIYTYTGWCKADGNYCFLHQGGAIGDEKIAVELRENMSKYNMSFPEVSFKNSVKAIETLFMVADKEVVFPLLALSFLSPLNEFLRQVGFEPAFLIFILGRTQTKKSTIAALFLSFFGTFTASGLPSSFKDTANSIERKNHTLKDVLTVIDDFHPASTYKERQNMDSIAQSLSRGFGDRTGRDRMQSDISFRPGYPPRGNAIVTGEDFPNIGQSGSARNFILELSATDIPNSNALDLSQTYASQGYFARFMAEYIGWLIPQSATLSSKLKQDFLTYRKLAAKEGLTGYGRTGDIIAWLKIGISSFFDFMQHQNYYSLAETVIKKQEAWEVFKKLVYVQFTKADEEIPTTQFLLAIGELLESKQVYLLPVSSSNADISSFLGQHAGYQDENFVYFLPSIIYGAVQSLFKAQNQFFPYTKNRIFKLLADDEFIEVEYSNGVRNTCKQKRIGTKKGRYLTFAKNKLFSK